MRKIGWLILTLALLMLIAPAMSVTQYNYTVGGDTIVVFNGTAGSTTWTVPAGVMNISYLVVAAGGGGASDLVSGVGGGGGGAGGFATNSSINVTTLGGSPLTVVVGAGGAGAGGGRGDGGQARGGNSSLGNIIAYGGGKGVGYGGTVTSSAISGSNGGGPGLQSTTTNLGTAWQGSAGYGALASWTGGGGGGGASQEGMTTGSSGGGKGGRGRLSNITGSPVWYAGGGAGGPEPGGAQGLGGLGGGGNGGTNVLTGTAGTANTGGGGGGACNNLAAGAGGSGIVVISYKTAPFNYTSGSDTIVVFNGTPGSYSWTAPTNVQSAWLTMVAGGGGGAGSLYGGGGNGGGGAGGFVNQTISITGGQTYLVVVGQGGQGGISQPAATNGRIGTNSSFGSIVAVYGGGGGAGAVGLAGASGGGGGSNGFNGGTKLTVTPSAQGNNGGKGATAPNYPGGGGGGAGSVGGDSAGTYGGVGGTGNVSAITGVSTYYGGGGGGASTGGGGTGGTGGGGDGMIGSSLTLPGFGTNNLGGGGGGATSETNTAGGDGGSGIVILRYSPIPAPIAQFTSNVTSGTVQLPVQFNDTSVISPTAWVWNFTYGLGTANSSTLQNPVYTYLNAGTFTVQLNVTNASFFNTTTSTITVTAPTAAPTSTFTVNKTLTYLPNGAFAFTSTATPNVYAWQWNYTTSTNTTPYTFSTSTNPEYTFTNPGIYYVTLKATNYLGSTTSTATPLIVNGFDAPRPSYIISPSTGTPGALIQFNDTSIVPNTAGLVYNWSFGTGSVELNPYSSTAGSVAHVYNYGGVYDINLSITNYNGTAFNYTAAGVTISTEQRMTNWYSPHQVRFRVLDANDNIIQNAFINATAYESSLPGGFAGAQQVLIEMYGINSISASQMVSSAVQMQGYTGDDGSTSFTMHGNLKYLIYVVDPSGNVYTKTIYPQMDQYLIRVTNGGAYTNPQDQTNVLATQGNATLTFSEPDIHNCTLGLDYMDVTGQTTSLTFTAKLLNNQTVMNTQTTAVTGSQHILLNYTVPNVRGQQWVWYYNATVV